MREEEKMNKENMAEKEMKDLIPRHYQITMMEAALDDNIIACLGTGTGKTFIGVLVIKQLAYQVRPPFDQDGKRTFFLVPTVPLVHQQAGVLSQLTDLKIGSFFGDMNLDSWSNDEWQVQFTQFNVLVMTAEIFRAILVHGFIPLSRVNLIVFDECHRAVKNHPYREIMRNFDFCTEHPKVLGLTASILNGKCKPGQLEKKIKNLEQTLRSKAIIPEEMSEISKYGTKPKEVLLVYSPNVSLLSGTVKDVRETLINTLMKLPSGKSSPKKNISDDTFSDDSDNEDDDINPYKIARKFLTDVIEILDTLGIWCACRTLEVFLDELEMAFAKDKVGEDKILVFTLIESIFSPCLRTLKRLILSSNHEDVLIGRQSPPKLKKLLEALRSKHPSQLQGDNPLCCVVFVQKRIVAYILNLWLLEVSKLPYYQFIKSNFMVGHGTQLFTAEIKAICMQSKQQKKILEDFRSKHYNLLVASSVIEEGMDVPQCNLVVRFDPPSDFRAYVQSKGRARAKRSIYLLMSADNEDKMKLLEDLTTYTSIEKILQNYCQDRILPTEEEIDYHMSDQLKEPYMPFPYDGGARVTMTSSISLLNRYCSKLMGDGYTDCAPRWRIRKVENDNGEVCFQCTIRLPMISPVREPIVGDKMKVKQHAKMAAALEACKILHKQGELDDNLLPINFKVELMEDGQSQESYQKELRLGASNVKGCYPKKVLSFEPVTSGTRCYFYTIHMKLIDAVERDDTEVISHFDPSTSRHKFVLIVKDELKSPVPFHIFTESGKVKVYLTEFGPVRLTQNELHMIHKFHEYTFTEMLRTAPFPLKYIAERNADWLLAPVIFDVKRSEKPELNYHLLERVSKLVTSKKEGSDLPSTGETRFSFSARDYQDALVYFVYEPSELYYVLRVCDNMSSGTSFPKEEFANYGDYFSRRYSHNVQNSNDPLVQVKHVSNPIHNIPGYLSQTKHFTKQSMSRLTRSIHFIPELLTILPYPGSLHRQATYLPCILSRVNSLIFVEALRSTIIKETGIGVENVIWPSLDFPGYPILTGNRENEIKAALCNKEREFMKLDRLFDEQPYFGTNNGPSPCLLLEALTSRHYGDLLDLERLETVGDSFLKYAVSLHLFCKYPLDNEGKLTLRKIKQISNANLLKLGRRREIPSIMLYTKMEPRENWLPPGFKFPAGFEETLAEISIQVSKCWLDDNMQNVWDLSEEEVRASLISLDEYIKNDIAKKQGSDEPVLLKLPPKLRTQNCIGNKSVADCVEGLIGAYVVTTGVIGGLYFLNWLGVEVFPEGKIPELKQIPNLKSCFDIPKQYVVTDNYHLTKQYLSGLENLENTIDYRFENKLYLLEALWHPSCDRKPVTGCYQRLEFLGDAVLDYLITRYLYEDPKHYNPGELTDIRMALVNNEYFAKLAVQNKFHQHMKYFSPGLVGAIINFVKKVENNDFNFFEEININQCDGAAEELEVPKVLGDIVESVAGAIYLDSGLSLKTVWKVFFRMMRKDIEATRKDVPKNPVRLLYESFPGKIKFQKQNEIAGGKMSVAVDIEAKDRNYQFIGIALNKKTAKLTAAKIALRYFQRETSLL